METGKVTIIKVIRDLTPTQSSRILQFFAVAFFASMFFADNNKKTEEHDKEVARLIQSNDQKDIRIKYLEDQQIKMVDEMKEHYKSDAVQKDSTNAILRQAVIKLSK